MLPDNLFNRLPPRWPFISIMGLCCEHDFLPEGMYRLPYKLFVVSGVKLLRSIAHRRIKKVHL